METNTQSTDCQRQQGPWNKGRYMGPKPPIQPKHVWTIRARLMISGDVRDLALLNLAIDSKLRGCDLVALRVDDFAPGGHVAERTTIRQRKTGRTVTFEITEQTRQAVEDYLRAYSREPWRLHDLRRTSRSLMSRAGVSADLAERVLNHALQGVRRVYDRHDYFDEKREALDALATLLDRILHPEKRIVVLRKARTAGRPLLLEPA